mgnify:CR=1 FL=1
MLRACYRVVAGGLWLVVGALLLSCKPHGPKSPVQAVAPVESLHCVAANRGETFLNLLRRAGLDSSRSQSVRKNLAAFDIVNPVCAAGESLVGFYRDALGLNFLFTAPPQMAFFMCGAVRLLVGVPPPGQQAQRGATIYFRVKDIEDVFATLKSNGVQFPAAPHIVHRAPDYELWLAEFNDPDGNQLALMSEVKTRSA